MANIDLVGQIPVELNHVFAVTATRMSVKWSQQVTVQKGALGVIGASAGIPDVSGTLVFSIPKTGMEFDIETLKLGSFTFSFPLGTEKYQITGCRITEQDITSNFGAGSAEVPINFVGGELKRIQ